MPLLVLACVVLMVLDGRAGAHSPLEPARSALGNVLGPAEQVADAAVRPFTRTTDFLRSQQSLRAEVSRLQARNDRLRAQLASTGVDRNRLAELDGLTRTARDTGYSLVAAQVIALGPAQSFGRTATIDAGSSSGVRADMTVVDNSGLVGRVVRVTRSTATVLLIVDRNSVVGGRLGSNLEIGTLRGRGDPDNTGRLDLQLVDNSVTPARGDTVVTWGSRNGVPYVAGIPIGRVVQVFSSPRESAKRAVIAPFVDFTSLDVVGVVVPRGTKGDRTVLSAGRPR